MSKVVVVGSTNTDMIVRVPRIPGPGETVLGRDFQSTGGGKGANQAVAAARAGAPVTFITALGVDEMGTAALERLRREGIAVDFVHRASGVASGVALIFVDDTGENSIAVAPGANAALRPEHVEPLGRILGAGDVVLLQLEIPLETVEAAALLAAERGARVILNPAPARTLPPSLLASVSLLTPNQAEAEQLSGISVSDERALRQAAAALHGLGVSDLLITLGGRGFFASVGGGSELVAGFGVEVVDTTAAGDVFNGALAAAYVEGQSWRDATRFANAAAALSVTRIGAQTSAPSRAEIENFLAQRS